MADISTLSALSNDSNLVNGATITHTENNTHRTVYRALINNLLTVASNLENHYSSASTPGDTPNGKIWHDSSNNVLKYRKSGAFIEVIDESSTQTLTNKTLTSPTITALSVTSGNITMYEAVNDANPELKIGSTSLEQAVIQVLYDPGTQAMDYLQIETFAASGSANKGEIRFLIDEVQTATFYDNGLDLEAGKQFYIADASVLNATTLGSGVLASSLTSVGTLTDLTITGDLTVDTDTLFVDASTDRVGIGTTTPSRDLEVYSSGTHYIKMNGLDEDTTAGFEQFSDSREMCSFLSYIGGGTGNGNGLVIRARGYIQFHTGTSGSFTERVRIDSVGVVAMYLNTETLAIVDAGSTSATEQDWIEVTVGGVTGYVRVYATK